MREMINSSLTMVPTAVLANILLAMSLVVGFANENRLGLGLTDRDQEIPPSPPAVSLSPDNLDFGKQVARRTSAAKRITVQNTGGKPLYIDSVVISGDNPNSFALLKDTCTGATVAPARACILDVTFTPSGTGERNARLRLNDNAPDSPQRLRLKGNGINSNDVPPF